LLKQKQIKKLRQGEKEDFTSKIKRKDPAGTFVICKCGAEIHTAEKSLQAFQRHVKTAKCMKYFSAPKSK
jgi:hypothetical protein